MAEISRGFFVIAGPCSGGVTGVDPPKKKSTQKFLGLPFYGDVERVQLENVTVTQ